MFKDDLIPEFIKWRNANPQNFNWWNYVNLKSDLQTALGFAKLYYPEIVELDGCILLKDKFSKELYELWKDECKGEKTCIEKMMNLYQLRDFFHRNTPDDGNLESQIKVLGDVLTLFWSMSFRNRFPGRSITVKVFEETDGESFITVYEEI
ncbi:conserved hypothetical protein [uncultured Sporomusa sp.]|uniref:Uncharacterized protein n=1 Tax=uncultured Sporomusa sp. TaxID=307249 RepID=A0A212LZR6_9FIRM|nr:hypothetical protein [uncultured Sporomusa sp.]SCM83042.1 conserved hypothetical protein [uncultured Sporomusa sp.]